MGSSEFVSHRMHWEGVYATASREGDTHNRLGRLSGSKSMCSAKRPPADGNLAASA